MFDIDENPEFTHPVTVKTPVDGGYREDTFKARFKALDEEDLQNYGNTIEGHKEMLRAVVTDLFDIVGDDKKPIPFTADLLEKLIGKTNARLALIKAYSGALNGARLGN